MQVADLVLAGGRGTDARVAPLEVPDSFYGEGPDEVLRSRAGNVARLYAKFARDLAEGTRTVPDFRHGVQRHRLVHAIESASATGVAQGLS